MVSKVDVEYRRASLYKDLGHWKSEILKSWYECILTVNLVEFWLRIWCNCTDMCSFLNTETRQKVHSEQGLVIDLIFKNGNWNANKFYDVISATGRNELEFISMQYKFNVYIPEDMSNKMNIPKQINSEGSQMKQLQHPDNVIFSVN